MSYRKWVAGLTVLLAASGFWGGLPITNDAGEQLYKTKCAMCHGGTVAEAPRFEALQRLSVNAITEALQTGVMKAQGASLTPGERRLVAEYISKLGSAETQAKLGQCNQAITVNTSSQKSRISSWGMGLGNLRYVAAPDLRITAGNVAQLSLSWAFAFPDATRARSQPTVVGNTLFTASQQGVIYALDIATGCIRWTFQADAEVRSAMVVGTDENGLANRIYFGDFKANVYALDLRTRQLVWRKRIDDHEQATITGSPVLYRNRLFVPVSSTEVVAAYNAKYPCCTFRGSVVALDVADGAVAWKTYMTTTPAPQALNSAGTQTYGPSGAPVWSSPTIDAKRGLLYIGTGENYSRPASPTSDAILALSLATGKINWIRQTISQDAWNAACTQPGLANCPDQHGPDYDFGAPPILVSRPGQPDLILAGQKSGMVYALNPDADGAIVWQRRVGRGGIMGGIHWGMASDGETLYVPINDHDAWPADSAKPAFPGLHALNVANGSVKWSVIEKDRCEKGTKWVCAPGLSAAITLIPGVVFGGSLDGMLHAYSTTDGRTLWDFNTDQAFDSVNGVRASGGTIDSSGPVVVGDQLFVNSGYAKFGEKAGNVLLAFTLKPKPSAK
ncbi:MAG: pvaA [Spirosoma sp.]|nr:pvaA [Spirosoma sp.]